MVPDQKVGRFRSRRTEWIGLLSFGFFVVALGLVWMITPDFSGEVVRFARSFNGTETIAGNVKLPVPVGDHSVLYIALMELCILIGAFQVVVLALRFVYRDSIDSKAGAVSGMVFWFSAAFFLNLLAQPTLVISWLGFLAGLIVSVGLAVVASNLVRLFK
jgi:hypothetical protein